MNRDLDYIRELLFEIEESDQQYILCRNSIGMKAEDNKKLYHAQLLCDGNLLCLVNEESTSFRMTNQGHDYLDSIRDDKIWSKIVNEIKPLGSVSLDVIKTLGTKYLSTKLGL